MLYKSLSLHHPERSTIIVEDLTNHIKYLQPIFFTLFIIKDWKLLISGHFDNQKDTCILSKNQIPHISF